MKEGKINCICLHNKAAFLIPIMENLGYSYVGRGLHDSKIINPNLFIFFTEGSTKCDFLYNLPRTIAKLNTEFNCNYKLNDFGEDVRGFVKAAKTNIKTIKDVHTSNFCQVL